MTIIDFYRFFESYDDYVTCSDMMRLQQEYDNLFLQYRKFRFRYLFQPEVLRFRKDFINLKQFVELYNQSYIQRQMKKYQFLLDHINGYALDLEQKTSIITDEDHNLVVAGAGSGKTLTIIGKIRYLVDAKQVKPSEILCISFTRDTTSSLKKAISKETDYDVDVYTFHKLGIEILKEQGKSVHIASDDCLRKIIYNFFENEIVSNYKLVEKLVKYFSYYIGISFSNHSFETMKSKIEKISEKVGSYEEWVIANYLYMHQVSYIYQPKYVVDIKDDRYGLFVSCFYIRDYDFYLEYFGSKQDFLDEIKWKRNIHQKYGTQYEEIFCSYFQEGVIFECLENIIQKYQINSIALSSIDLYFKYVKVCQKTEFYEFQKLLATFIHLFKANGYDGQYFEELKQKIESMSSSFMRDRYLIFLNIVYRVYMCYQLYLKDHNEYDFDDMIYEAVSVLKEKGTSFSYRYIIVDEYQDTSMARYHLIYTLKKVMNSKVMVVGDDWQSIYRFTGCDLNVFLKFQEYFEYSKVLKIQNTYRNSQQLIDVAGSFVMKNTRQLKKKLTSVKQLERPIRLFYYYDVKQITELLDLVIGDEVFVLGRNNRDIQMFYNNSLFQVKDNFIIYIKRPDMKIIFLTVHRSKGLECEEVILINLTDSIMGFPNKMVDDFVLQLINPICDLYPYEEERRLFYVALTRTKSYVYLFVPKKNPSIFVEELVHDYRSSILFLNNSRNSYMK